MSELYKLQKLISRVLLLYKNSSNILNNVPVRYGVSSENQHILQTLPRSAE